MRGRDVTGSLFQFLRRIAAAGRRQRQEPLREANVASFRGGGTDVPQHNGDSLEPCPACLGYENDKAPRRALVGAARGRDLSLAGWAYRMGPE